MESLLSTMKSVNKGNLNDISLEDLTDKYKSSSVNDRDNIFSEFMIRLGKSISHVWQITKAKNKVIEKDDYESIAMETLLKCIEHFDKAIRVQDKPVQFNTYYINALKKKVLTYITGQHNYTKKCIMNGETFYLDDFTQNEQDMILYENGYCGKTASSKLELENLLNQFNSDEQKIVMFILKNGKFPNKFNERQEINEEYGEELKHRKGGYISVHKLLKLNRDVKHKICNMER